MFSLVKSWSDRSRVKKEKLRPINNRTWIRRIQWLEDENNRIKLKFDDGAEYNEIGVLTSIAAQAAWDRFKAGAKFEDLKSIFGVGDIKVEQSIKASKNEK